jgi:hypothetical protein
MTVHEAAPKCVTFGVRFDFALVNRRHRPFVEGWRDVFFL